MWKEGSLIFYGGILGVGLFVSGVVLCTVIYYSRLAENTHIYQTSCSPLSLTIVRGATRSHYEAVMRVRSNTSAVFLTPPVSLVQGNLVVKKAKSESDLFKWIEKQSAELDKLQTCYLDACNLITIDRNFGSLVSLKGTMRYTDHRNVTRYCGDGTEEDFLFKSPPGGDPQSILISGIVLAVVGGLMLSFVVFLISKKCIQKSSSDDNTSRSSSRRRSENNHSTRVRTRDDINVLVGSNTNGAGLMAFSRFRQDQQQQKQQQQGDANPSIIVHSSSLPSLQVNQMMPVERDRASGSNRFNNPNQSIRLVSMGNQPTTSSSSRQSESASNNFEEPPPDYSEVEKSDQKSSLGTTE